MVPILAARRPTDSFALEDGVTTTPPLAPVAHATRGDLFDVFMGGTRNRTRDPIRTRMITTSKGAIMGLRVGLAARFTDDRPFSESLSISLAEFQALLFTRLGRRLPGLSFLRYEIRDLARRAGHAFHGHTTGLVREAAPGSIFSSILLDPSITIHDF